MVWTDRDDGGLELGKIYHLLPQYTRGRVLDIGSGNVRLFGHWVTLDDGRDYQGQRVADLHLDGAGPLPFADGAFDAVVSSHFLEHVVDWKAALAEWWRLVKVGGHLVLYLPHRDHYPRIGEKGANVDHKHDFAPDDIFAAMDRIRGAGWVQVESETRIARDEYSFFHVYRKADNGWRRDKPLTLHDKRSVLVARPGAIGDVMLATAVLDQLAEQYERIDFLTTPLGAKLLKADPRISRIITVDEDQIPNDRWAQVVSSLGRDRYSHWVNLTGTVEGGLLFLPGTVEHAHPKETRARLALESYLVRTCRVAGVQTSRARVAFHPTKTEAENARRFIGGLPGPVIMWMLGGSAVHKEWPYIHTAIPKLFAGGFKGTVFAAGDASLKGTLGAVMKGMVDAGQDPSRIIGCDGDVDIRDVMALAQHCDMIIGPETGVLQGMAHERMPKLVLMSHSAPHNLTAGWENAFSATPKHVACWPCHILHVGGWEHCHQDPVTKAAACAAGIQEIAVLHAIREILPADAFTAKEIAA